MELFRNRAKLKKSFNNAQDDLQQLRDRLKQQEGVTARSQELLGALEARLSQPETAFPAVVFYQLRDLWAVGRSLLTRFISDLRAQREAVEREAFQREFQRQRELRVAALDRICQSVEARATAGAATVQSLGQRLARLQRWWNYFQRRSAQRQLLVASREQAQVADELEAACRERDLAAGEPEPRFPGISLPVRRAINLAAIAYAHVLHERLENSGLLEPMRSALAAEEAPADAYGDRAACELLMAQIQRTRWSLQQRIMMRDELQHVNLGLRPLVRYVNDHASVPDAEALIGSSEHAGTRVLQDDAWQLRELLL